MLQERAVQHRQHWLGNTVGQRSQPCSLTANKDNRFAQWFLQLVVLDMTMPRMDGMAALREMRLIREDVNVILSSSSTEQDAMDRAKSLLEDEDNSGNKS